MILCYVNIVKINIQALISYFYIHVVFVKQTLRIIDLSSALLKNILSFLVVFNVKFKSATFITRHEVLKMSLLSQFGCLSRSGCKRRDCCLYVCLFASVACAEVLLFRWWDLASAQRIRFQENAIRTTCQLYLCQ